MPPSTAAAGGGTEEEEEEEGEALTSWRKREELKQEYMLRYGTDLASHRPHHQPARRSSPNASQSKKSEGAKQAGAKASSVFENRQRHGL